MAHYDSQAENAGLTIENHLKESMKKT